MAPPTPQSEPTPDDITQAVLARFVHARAEAGQRWAKRGTWVGYGVAAVVFLLTTVATMDAVPDWSILISLFAAVAAMAITITMVYPRLTQPSLPCPHCARRVPLAETPMSPFTTVKVLRLCPYCKGDLPD